MKKATRPTTCDESDAIYENRTSRPIQASGIGRRIDEIAVRIGTRKNAALVAKVSTDTLQRWIRGENMPAFDTAARLCLAAGVRMEWLATGEGPMLTSEIAAPAAALDEKSLRTALELVEEALEGRQLAPALRAELVGHVYALIVAPGELPSASISRLLRVATGGSDERAEDPADTPDRERRERVAGKGDG